MFLDHNSVESNELFVNDKTESDEKGQKDQNDLHGRKHRHSRSNS